MEQWGESDLTKKKLRRNPRLLACCGTSLGTFKRAFWPGNSSSNGLGIGAERPTANRGAGRIFRRPGAGGDQSSRGRGGDLATSREGTNFTRLDPREAHLLPEQRIQDSIPRVSCQRIFDRKRCHGRHL